MIATQQPMVHAAAVVLLTHVLAVSKIIMAASAAFIMSIFNTEIRQGNLLT